MIEALGGFLIRKSTGARALARLAFKVSWGSYRQVFGMRFRFRDTVGQMFALGVESLPVLMLALTFISLMMILEFSFHMKLVLRQDSLVPAFSTVLMVRELGPVVTCLLLASRIGAGIAAEIGTMKITEQLDALRLLSIDPVEYLAIPRFFGSVFAAVSLSVVSVGVAILAGAAIGSVQLGYTLPQFFNTMFIFTRFSDFLACLVKAAAFGAVIPLVAAHQGLRCGGGAEGVGQAATAAVVDSSIYIIALDFIVTYLFYAI